jgi:predicted amidophosphoribosyltransferase
MDVVAPQASTGLPAACQSNKRKQGGKVCGGVSPGLWPAAYCRERKCAFELARRYGQRVGALVRGIRLNYERPPASGPLVADIVREAIRADEKGLSGDRVASVPLDRQQKKRAGVQSGRVVCSAEADASPARSICSTIRRGQIVSGAFAVKVEGRVDNSGILLLDDVMTTGAMLDACSRVLFRAGASSVIALTLARAVRPTSPADR